MYLWNNIALIEDDTYFTKWVKECGRLDHHQGFLKTLKPYLKGTILDVGANVGTHSIYYARYGYVICFEANPIAFECLTHNMRHENCLLLNRAVSNKDNQFIDMVNEGTNYGAQHTTPGTTIETITIDSLNLIECNFIKMDIEGDELAALQGAKETIAEFKPVLCVECNLSTLVRKNISADDLISYITSFGYKTSVRQPEDISCDLICVPT